MAWSKRQLLMGVMMVFTGSINTLSTKWADTMESLNSVGEMSTFVHPFFQADAMFIGEMSCMAAFYITRVVSRMRSRRRAELTPSEGHQPFPPLIFYVPAFCDMIATSTMYLGLTLTFASSFQMLRGAVIVFTGILSTAFLGQKLRYYSWIGICVVIVGLVVVGVSDFLTADLGDYTMNGIITGDLLIVAAQIVTATQMVVEQKFLTKYNVPSLLAVGWEGVFGFITLSILLVPFSYIPGGIFSGNPRGMLEDPYDAFVQLGNNGWLIVAVLGNIISISFFNFAGVSVTKELNATTRMVLDSVRTLVVWLFSLAVGWQNFQYLQPIGFVMLVLGMFLYNDAIIMPFFRQRGWIHDGVPSQPLIEEVVDYERNVDASSVHSASEDNSSRSDSKSRENTKE
uniref:Solute carrier family 35 member F6-like n=1 Tax=Hirondellea gigas TaxID=1518452 RepID=A0A2P2HZN8_9CRUS